jgi:hypothetical protein
MKIRDRGAIDTIATCYTSEFEHQWVTYLFHPSRTDLRHTSFLYNEWGRSFSRLKLPGRGVDHPPHIPRPLPLSLYLQGRVMG